MKTRIKIRNLSQFMPVRATLAGVAVCLVTATPIVAQDGSPATNAINVSDASTDSSIAPTDGVSTGLIRVGDSLQISFFEHLDFGRNTAGEIDSGARTFYQRLDLTGAYVVDVDGSVVIPLLGRFELDELTPQGAQARIKEGYETTMNRLGEVHVSISERQPVFVTGIVRNSGSFDYRPGMIAAQAIALAGGYDRNMQASARILDSMREEERVDRSSRELAQLLAKRTRLLKLRELNASKETRNGEGISPQDLATLAQDMSESDAQLLTAEYASIVAAANLDQVLLANAQREVEALHERSKLVDQQREIRSDHLRVISQMQDRGLSTLERMWTAQLNVADLEISREELVSDTIFAENRVEQHRVEGETRILADAARIEREIMETEDAIGRMQAEIDAAARLRDTLRMDASADGLGPDEELVVLILRRSADGVVTIASNEASSLFPGDVVKIERAAAVSADIVVEDGRAKD